VQSPVWLLGGPVHEREYHSLGDACSQPVKTNNIFGTLPGPSDTTFHTNILMEVPISTKLIRRSRGLLHGWCTVSTRKKSSS